jgi:hypothetical protein
MNQKSSDITKFKEQIFQQKDVLGQLLLFSLKLMEAKQAGLVYGTDTSLSTFLPPEKWDRGLVHKIVGRGFLGVFLKFFGRVFVYIKKISPVLLYRINGFGNRIETEGVISYVLRNHQDFYKKGIKILIIDNLICDGKNNDTDFSVICYDGRSFNSLSNIRVNVHIVRQFKPQNFIAAYIPDFGAIVFNTVDPDLLSTAKYCFVRETDLKKRLDKLILAIESASLAYLGFVEGKTARQVILRKERELRKVAHRLKEKELQLDLQKKYLRALGGVTMEQLNMTPLSISNGVYAFIDMVGSTTIRENIQPRDFFQVLNFCHEIAARNADLFACRVDNFMGDSVFFPEYFCF